MADKHFTLDMTIAQALEVNPRAAEVFAAFHLGGCAHCHINRVETLEQVCAGYGIDPNQLLEVLEGVMETSKA
jgi:hybrid cluster-associated redox disulfide protein